MFLKFIFFVLVSNSFKNLFENMTNKDPNKRITINNVMQHDWWLEPTATKE